MHYCLANQIDSKPFKSKLTLASIFTFWTHEVIVLNSTIQLFIPLVHTDCVDLAQKWKYQDGVRENLVQVLALNETVSQPLWAPALLSTSSFTGAFQHPQLWLLSRCQKTKNK